MSAGQSQLHSPPEGQLEPPLRAIAYKSVMVDAGGDYSAVEALTAWSCLLSFVATVSRSAMVSTSDCDELCRIWLVCSFGGAIGVARNLQPQRVRFG